MELVEEVGRGWEDGNVSREVLSVFKVVLV